MAFQSFEDGSSDRKAWKRDLHRAGLAEPLGGFDTLSCVEHHFSSYAISPDITQVRGHMEHYDMAGAHFERPNGYGDCAQNGVGLRNTGISEAAQRFVDINTHGTPQQILENQAKRRHQLGDFDLTIPVSYGGLTGAQHAAVRVEGAAQVPVLADSLNWSARSAFELLALIRAVVRSARAAQP